MANTETMTVHRALSELKTLDKRIADKIDSTTFCRASKHESRAIDGKPISEYEKEIKEMFNSIRTLINRRKAMRQAVIQSNAVTMVQVAGREYSVAEAIEMKNHGIELLAKLRDEMLDQWQIETHRIDSENGEKLSNKADSYIAQTFGSKDAKGVDVTDARDKYVASQTFDLIDPIGMKAVIAGVSDDIDTFCADVDAALSVSNAITNITFSYETM